MLYRTYAVLLLISKITSKVRFIGWNHEGTPLATESKSRFITAKGSVFTHITLSDAALRPPHSTRTHAVIRYFGISRNDDCLCDARSPPETAVHLVSCWLPHCCVQGVSANGRRHSPVVQCSVLTSAPSWTTTTQNWRSRSPARRVRRSRSRTLTPPRRQWSRGWWTWLWWWPTLTSSASWSSIVTRLVLTTLSSLYWSPVLCCRYTRRLTTYKQVIE